ncbi:immunoglobulin domain-containing protein [Nibricoccus sp. IMCC34717]|uniref:immunoglobulin domain-containing protein n=1 Tax=Nibricoccus sp. IMCC34717 TaxID=3034021 RepID=UPI00384B5E01
MEENINKMYRVMKIALLLVLMSVAQVVSAQSFAGFKRIAKAEVGLSVLRTLAYVPRPAYVVNVELGGTLELKLRGIAFSKNWKRITPTGVENVTISDRVSITDDTLTITNFSAEDEGSYFVENSEPVPVVAGRDQRITAISSRFTITSENRTQITGFIVDGMAPKIYVIRGVGPSLRKFGIGNALEDPVIAVYDSKGNLVSIEGWLADRLLEATNHIGAFPLDKDSAEPVKAFWLDPGAYTVVVSSKSGKTGEALCEVYEARYDLEPTSWVAER